MRPLYHVGDPVIIYELHLDGNIIAYPRGDFFMHELYDLTHSPIFSNYDYLYDERNGHDVRTTSDDEIYIQVDSYVHDYMYIIQLSTGEMVHCYEHQLIVRNRDPLYHVGDLVSIDLRDIHLVGNIIAYPRGNFLTHWIFHFEPERRREPPYVTNCDSIYHSMNQIHTTSDGQLYAYYDTETVDTYLYIVQLSTGEMVHCDEEWLAPFNRELLTRSINKFRKFRKRKRDDTVSAIALGTKMPLNINRHIASLTLRPLSSTVGGRKKKRKTKKTRKTKLHKDNFFT